MAIEQSSSPEAPQGRARTSPIAIIGMSGKFPGEASNLGKLWDLCSQGRDAWTPIPSTRFNHEAFYHPDPTRNGSNNVKGGFFLEEDLARFDAAFFGFTKAEAASLDPEQRLLLECAYETFENAGVKLEDVSGTETGVYVGTFMNDWGEITRRDPDALPIYQPTGSGHAMLAGRLSYFYNLKGPSMTMDTACSASFVALHNACSALRNGECTSALVGGVNSLLNHDFLSTMSSMSFLSADGRSYTYDKRANGYARGEGVTCILIKPLDQAVRDGDTIRAVIRGVALNQDGRTPGITHPSGSQQAALIRKVYEDAGLSPDDTSYLETHGTGTQAGDVTEAKALHEAFGQTRKGREPLIVGSIKTNIGHLEGASGLAGLVKTVMMLEHEVILPNYGFTEANAKIHLDEWNMKVPTQLRPWTSPSKILRASINNFGYAGTNAHVIVEQAKGYFQQLSRQAHFERPINATPGINGRNGHPNGHRNGLPKTPETFNGTATANGSNGNPTNGHHSPRTRLFVLSAFDEFSCRSQAQLLASHLRSEDTGPGEDFLARLANTLAERRSRFSRKMAVMATTKDDLALALETAKSHNSPKVPSLGFIFTGQGAQWYAMGRELISLPGFRASLDLSSACLSSLGAGWNVIEELSRDPEGSRVNQATLSQPLCTILQLALVDLLESWNIMPAAVVGHSSGELAAAYAAGLASRHQVISAAYHRGLVAASSNEGHDCLGAMAAIPAAEERVLELLARVKNGKAAIACYNSPSILTVSGDETAITELVGICKSEGINARKLLVDVAYHSSRMIPVVDKYIDAMKKAETVSSSTGTNGHKERPPKCDMYSSVTGTRYQDGHGPGPEYWAENLTKPVRFTDAVTAMCTDSGSKVTQEGSQKSTVNCLVEIGPHSALAGPLRQILQSQSRLSSISYLSALTRNHNAMDTALSLAARLFEKGCLVDITAVNGGVSSGDNMSLLTTLPSYPWNHETSYWAEPRASKQYRNRKWPRHDLLGAPVKFSNELEPRWRNWMRVSEVPWLRDHRVNGLMVYPAAGYIAMAIEGSRQQALTNGTEIEGYELRDLRIGQALVIPDSVEEIETMMTMKPYSESAKASSTVWNEFFVYSAAEDGSWAENCRGLISVRARSAPNEVNGAALVKMNEEWHENMRGEVESACIKQKPAAELYSSFSSIGLEYEGTFSNVTTTAFGSGKALGKVIYPDVETCMPMHHHSPFVIHPAFLDSTFQVAFFGVIDGLVKSAMVPTFISHVYVSDSITKVAGEELAVYTQVDRIGLRDTDISLHVYNDKYHKNNSVVSVSSLTMTSLTGSMEADLGRNAAQAGYAPRWHPEPELLLTEQLTTLCAGLRVDGPDDETLRLLDEATFYMAEEALEQVPEARLSDLTEKSQKLYGSFQRLRDNVYAGNMPQDVSRWIGTNADERATVWKRVRAAGDEGALYLALKENLHRIILEEIDPLSVVMKDDVLAKYYAADVRMSTQCRQAAAYVDLLANKNPQLKILEVGAGTGGATIPILRALGGEGDSADDIPRFVSYDVTDITTGFFEKLQQRTKPWTNLLNFRKLNIEQDPDTQGYELESYDLVVASNVLHATGKMERTLDHVKRLLKPGGRLVLVELMKDVRICTRIFGVFDGWWIGAGDRRTDSPLLDEPGWDALLIATGFTGLDLAVWDLPDPEVHQGTTMVTSRAMGQATSNTTTVSPIVVVATVDDLERPLVKALQTEMGTQGQDNVQAMDKLKEDGRSAIVLTELSYPILKDPTPSDFIAMQNVLLDRDIVLWVTRGASVQSTDPDLNLASGMLATLRAEMGTSLAHLDLGSDRSLDDPDVASAINRVFLKIANRTGVSGDNDLDFVERNGVIMIRRFEKDDNFSRAVSSTMGTLVPEMQPFVQSGRPLKLKVGKPGLLDSLYFVDDEAMTEAPRGDEVDIEVQATALNFRDVMMAMGQIETYDLGAECSGVVTRVGPDVKTVQVGDRVLAQAFGTFSTLARTREIFVSKLSPEISMEEAATLPIVYTTAVYAIKVARLTAGETVLIHCAAGGLGQALVMLCKLKAADVYITVGTAQKKQFMMETYGIPEARIFSSRDTSFEKGIMRATKGRGIDVVFNSLSSDLLRATWACIASFGRFIELGKRDFATNSRLEMAKFARNVTFAAVDLAAVIQERPEEAAEVQKEAVAMVMDGKVHAPQPVSTYTMEELQKALRTMQTGRHMGKLVIKPTATDSVKVLPKKHARAAFRPDASYLLVGGLGGIGKSWASRMIELGARHLIFMSPSGARKPAARAAVEEMRESGASIHVFECDVGDRGQLSSCLAQTSSLPPIKGVFHGGSNFTSKLFKNMTIDMYNSGIRPKVHSTWNLHELLPKDLDHFVFFSSATGIVGNASQAAYSAASAFQDAFADYRNNTLGLPAVSIDLGMIGEIGHVAHHDDVRRNLEGQGYHALSPEECMAIIEAAVLEPSRAGKSGNVATGLSESDDGESPVYSKAGLALLRRAAMLRSAGGISGQKDGEGGGAGGSGSATQRVRHLLKKASTLEEVEQHVVNAILAKTCSLLMVSTDDVDVGKPMSQYGLDSLIAVEMRNWISSDIEVTVPVLQLLGNQSIQELSKSIAHQTRVAKALNAKTDQ